MEMLRFTKYPLLLDNIAKYTGKRGNNSLTFSLDFC